MRTVYAYIQLLIMVMYLLRPVMPFIEYTVNKKYIAANLCENRDKPNSCCEGKCYLEKQVRKSMEGGDASENKSNKLVQSEDFNDVILPAAYEEHIAEKSLIQPVHLEPVRLSKYIHLVFVPPEKINIRY